MVTRTRVVIGSRDFSLCVGGLKGQSLIENEHAYKYYWKSLYMCHIRSIVALEDIILEI